MLSVTRCAPATAELVVRATTIAARGLEFGAMVEAILDLAVTCLGADAAHLSSVLHGEELRLEGHRNVPPDLIAELADATIHHGALAGHAAATRAVAVVHDVPGPTSRSSSRRWATRCASRS